MKNSTLMFLLAALTSVFINCCRADMQILPPSRTIDVIEMQKYRFGIEEDGVTTNITKCYYSSDTGITGSFEVVKRSENILVDNTEVAAEHNIISDLGNVGLCQMFVEFADDTGPRKWTLIPYDEITGANLSPVTFTVNLFYPVPVLNDAIVVHAFTDFYQYMDTDIKFSTCKLSFEGTEIDLPLDSTQLNTFIAPYSEENENRSGKISALGRGLCGFKFVNASVSDSLQWILDAVDKQSRLYRAIFTSLVKERPSEDDLYQKQEVIVGSKYNVPCGNITTLRYDYCFLYTPLGKLISKKVNQEDCRYSLKTIKMEDLGIWRCVVGLEGLAMENVVYTVELVEKGGGPIVIETWVNETENYISIGCQLRNASSTLIFLCIMTAPNNQTFNLQLGHATNRYLPIGLNFEEGICAMQIEKPLHEYEKGLWRCEMWTGAVADGYLTGGFIKVANEEIADYPKYTEVTTQLGQSFTIYCEVPYLSEYCSIKAPSGTKYPTDNEMETRLGRCSHTVRESNATHNGTWSCSFARATGMPDEVITVEVIIGEALIYHSSPEVYNGNDVQLMCSTGGYPIEYCQFISPSGASYYIHNHEKSTGISYFGQGYEYGDCGIIIPKAQTSDSGTWTCVTKIVGSEEGVLSASLSLSVNSNFLSEPNLAIAIGTAVGVVLVGTIIGFVAMRRWRRRRHTEIASPSTAVRQINDGDNTSLDSEIDIFSLGPPPRSSTNPTTVREEELRHPHQM